MRYRPPGLLPADCHPEVVMMICTSGHVDHGKTRLVKLLTGCNTDRLAAEQQRGLTIELGFAPCFLGGDLCVGIVDVPGHEKFIKNMVAGVSGIEMTILVIAADDGIMPQTIEHFQIMGLLGVRDGIIALTKTDLVSKDVADRRIVEIRDFLVDTFMEDAPICPVSSETLDGYSEFYSVLVDHVRALKKQPRAGIFRMPVERVFYQQGFGCIVTGIPVSGIIRVGDQIEVAPANLSGRVRGLQCFLRDASQGGCGQCLALNVPDFGKKPPVRGQVIGLPGYLKSARFFHIRVRSVSGLANPLRNAEEIKFHTGTLEAHGKIHLLENNTLGESQSGLATVALAKEVMVAVGDRVIIRRPSPARTVAGGEVLAVTYTAARPRKRDLLDRLKAYERFFEHVDATAPDGLKKKVEYYLRMSESTVATPNELSRSTLLPLNIVENSLCDLEREKKSISLDPKYCVHADVYGACLCTIKARLKQAAEEDKVLSLTTGDILKGKEWPMPIRNRILKDLESSNLVAANGSRLILRAAADNLTQAERDVMGRLLTLYDDTGFQSPRPDELPTMLEAPQDTVMRMLEHLCNEGKLVRLSGSVVLSYGNFRKAQDLVIRIVKEDGKLDSADFKYKIGSTRKYALAILDFLDLRRVTSRIENNRKLMPDYQNHLL